MANREFLMASPLSGGLNTGVPQVSTITASENGVAHLDRLLVGAASTVDVVGYNGYDLGLNMEVQSLLINGSIELIRGRNAPASPGSIFSPARVRPIVSLGDWTFGTGDTVALTGQVAGAGILGNLTTAVPFSPRNVRLGYTGVPPASRATFAGSPAVAIAGGAALNVTVTFDQDGIADLDSMIVSGGPNPSAVAGASISHDALTGAYVTQITLPSGDQIILGQAQFGAAASIFSATRPGNWFSPGQEWVSAGSQIVFNIANVAAQGCSFQVGMPFYPGTKGDRC